MNSVVELIESGHLPKTYEKLVAFHVPRPIREKVMYENTVAIVDALPGHGLNRDQDDYLEILSDLIESHEDENLPGFPRLSEVEMLQFLMVENEMTCDDLAKLLKVDRSVAYKILKGSRNLTAGHIRKLCERFACKSGIISSKGEASWVSSCQLLSSVV